MDLIGTLQDLGKPPSLVIRKITPNLSMTAILKLSKSGLSASAISFLSASLHGGSSQDDTSGLRCEVNRGQTPRSRYSSCMLSGSSVWLSWSRGLSRRIYRPPLHVRLRTETSLLRSWLCSRWRRCAAGWGSFWSGWSTFWAAQICSTLSTKATALGSYQVSRVPPISFLPSWSRCS